MKRSWTILLVLSMVLAACGGSGADTTTAATVTTAAPTTTEAETTTTAEPELGTAGNPIQVLFVPSVDTQVIVSGGEVMTAALEEATGLVFDDVVVPISYAATVQEMCAAPDRTMGFIPGLVYVLAANLCGVDVGFKAVRFGYDVYWAQFLVQRESGIDSLDDLAGLSWAYVAGSTSGYMVPLLELQEAGIEAGATVEAGEHRQAALAVYRGDVDFATTFYSPPLLPEGTWSEGDDPDIPADLVSECVVTPEDQLWCGDYRVLDARAQAASVEAPDIIQQVRILSITQGIPNDTLSFGPDFPADIRAQIEDALIAFAETPEWEESIGNQDFYGWTGIRPADDAEYDGLRTIVDLVGISLDNI